MGVAFKPHVLKLLKVLLMLCGSINASAARIRCGRPGRPYMGTFKPVQDSYEVNSTITYSCAKPSLISKPDQRICQADGTWSGDIPLCNQRADIQQVLQSSSLKNMTAAKAIDKDPSTCFSTDCHSYGYWSAILPEPSTVTAVRIDFPKDKEVNAEVSVKGENSGEVLCNSYSNEYGLSFQTKTYYCPENSNTKFVHVRDRSVEARCFEFCEVDIFVRKEIQCVVGDVPYNGYGKTRVSGSVTEYHYYCNPGYILIGEPRAVCQSSGTWAPKAPTCFSIQCRLPRNPINGSVYVTKHIGDVVPYNGRVDYHCNPGFVLHGNPTRFCTEWNKWSGEEPFCIAKECGPITTTTVANGKISFNSTVLHSAAILVCDEGFRPVSDDRIHCLASGMWSYASLNCAPIRCDPNPSVPHGSFRLLNNSTFYGSHLQVTCSQGFVASGESLRMCKEEGTWGDLSDICVEISCASQPLEMPENGIWTPSNDSLGTLHASIRVLTCHSGYHIEGGPPVVRCLHNGSWSYTVATCRKTPEAVMQTSDWSSSAMFVSAVLVGAATAVCILCLVAIFLGVRRRRQSRKNTTVFHVDVTDSCVIRNTMKGFPMSPEDHYYTSTTYEDFPEIRQNPPVPKPRKPSAGLPLLPLDTDPVYAQPFELGSSTSVANKSQRNGYGSREDPYSGHIYAEPIDSRRPPSGSSAVSGCVAETWFRSGTAKMSRKMSLPDCQQIPKSSSSLSVHKANDATGMFSSASLFLEGDRNQFTECLETHPAASSGSLGLCAELQNAIYIKTEDRNLQLQPFSDGLQMISNDIYLDEYFSQA